MDKDLYEFLKDIEVVPVGENGEIEILPVTGNKRLNASKLPCGLPPILPDTKELLNSFLDNPEKLPIFNLDAVQNLFQASQMFQHYIQWIYAHFQPP
ncbi:hypothetical protein JTE90_005822 [Oedothorax gibbosus]|uniref:Uncharacterized protein n=1 Tax=Oedothorax gibbosus TaxID=931172 RepID=A0AAV6V568_9ARAC|nr:hypothetical protein JTE90_005822 [Oedothorax gibbosus]